MYERWQSRALVPKQYEAYYEQKSRLSALGVSIPPQMNILEIQAPFAKLAIDVLTEVLVPSGYIIGDAEDDGAAEDGPLDLLQTVWQYNDLDSQFSLAVTEALATGQAFWLVAPPDDTHEFTSVRAVDHKHAAARLDYKGSLIEGICVYKLPDGSKGATYYTPEKVQFLRNTNMGWRRAGGNPSPEGARILPMFNRARLRDRYGRSDLAELTPIIDAASRTLTNLQIAQELFAMPTRFLVGDGAGEFLSQFADRMQAYMGSLLGVPAGTQVTQLTGSGVDAFLGVYRQYALQISAMTGIPPSMMGVMADSNPTSAEALRVAKDRLIARAESKQRLFSDTMEKLGRLIIQLEGGKSDGLERLELTWRDPAAPSVSARMANALTAQAQGVISADTAREYLMLTPEQLRREAERSRDLDVMSGMSIPGIDETAVASPELAQAAQQAQQGAQSAATDATQPVQSGGNEESQGRVDAQAGDSVAAAARKALPAVQTLAKGAPTSSSKKKPARKATK